MEEEIIEEEKWYKGPIKIIIGLFLLFIVVLMSVPFYWVKYDPNPSYVPSVDEVFLYNMSATNETFVLTSNADFAHIIKPHSPIIKNTANKIVTLACIDSNKVCHAKAIYYFVRDNFHYISDPVNFEYVERTEDFMLSGGGDCESGTLAMANLMQSVGIKTELVLIPGHAFLRIKLPSAISAYKQKNDWIYLDWTCKDCDFGKIPYQDVGRKETYVKLS